MNNELTLVYVNPIGKDSNDIYEYEFFFSETPETVWAEDWNIPCPSSCSNLLPDETMYSVIKHLRTDILLTCAQENSCFSLQDVIDNILAISWQDINEVEEYPEHRLVFHFGETYEDVVNELQQVDLEFEEKEDDENNNNNLNIKTEENMEFTYKRRFKENFEYLKVLVPVDVFDYDEFEIDGETCEGLDKVFETYPQLKENDCLKLMIELETGKVINWPKELTPFDFYDNKIVDEGIYRLMKGEKESDDDIQYEGYVPTCIGEGGYGDYFEFEIDEKCCIKDWEFDNSDYNEFLKSQDDWDDEDDEDDD